jgi:hypothetical protein
MLIDSIDKAVRVRRTARTAEPRDGVVDRP